MTCELLNIMIDWITMFNGLDIDATWSLFHSIMLQLIDKYVPTSSIKLAGPKPMWINSAAFSEGYDSYEAETKGLDEVQSN